MDLRLLDRWTIALGRTLVAAIFVVSGLEKVASFSGVTAYVASKGLPFPALATAATITLEIGGGLCLILGRQVRLAAALFFAWLIPTTVLFHPFWAVDAAQSANELNHFLKNVSIMGAMALLFAPIPTSNRPGARPLV